MCLLRRLNESLPTIKYLAGYENDTHSNIIWNEEAGWFGYTCENYVHFSRDLHLVYTSTYHFKVIIEFLREERFQKVITLSDYLSVMKLSPDKEFIAVGSATMDQQMLAVIYIISTYNFSPLFTLKLHDRGVQDFEFSTDSKYLVSCGNFKENRVVVWNLKDQAPLAHSKLPHKINEVKIMPKNLQEKNIIEFVTIGGEQLTYWSLNKENQLSRFAVFFTPVTNLTIPAN